MGVELGTAATQDSSAFATAAQGLEADAAVKSVVAGSNVIVDNTDPQNPIVSASALTGYIGNPSVAPVLSSVSGGTLAAATYYVKITYENSTGETLPSPESNLAVALDNLLVVDSPSSATNATGYNVYVSTTTGTETKQNSTPISIGTNWTEPTSGLISGSALPSSNTTGTVGGTVSSVSVAAANGFLATVANPTTTPDITIKTGVTGILYGNGTGVSAAVPANFPTLTSLGAVATIAALRLYSGTAFGQTVFMQGYTTQNDGGQGPFQWGAYATDNGGTTITPTGQSVGSWYRIYDEIDSRYFGAKNDWNGTSGTDNTTLIQAAMNYVGSAGGGKVIVRGGGIYNCATSYTSGGLAVCLVTLYDNVELCVEEGTILQTNQNATLFGTGGFVKPGGWANWFTYLVADSTNYGTTFILYAINIASKYANSVTLVTPAQSSNFLVGDWILIRTGQIDVTGFGQPLGEYNQILAINATTGVLTLKYPLRNLYQQENYPPGHPDAGNPAPFGIVNCTRPYDVLLKNFKLTGLGTIQNTVAATGFAIINGNQHIGFSFSDLTVNSYNAIMSMGASLATYDNLRLNMLTSSVSGDAFSIDTCNHDTVFNGSIICAAGYATCEISEGSSAILSNITILNANPAIETSSNVISVRGRTHDIVLDTIKIFGYNGNSNPAIYIDPTIVSGSLDNLLVVGGSASIPTSIAVAQGSTDIAIGALQTDGGVSVGYDSSNTLEGGLSIYLGPQSLGTFQGNPTLTLGIPAAWETWNLSNGQATPQYLTWIGRVPPNWKKFQVRFWITNLSTAAGNVALPIQWRVQQNTNNINGGVTGSTEIIQTIGTQYVLVVTPLSAGTMSVADGDIIELIVGRDSTNASDTLAGIIGLVGIELIRIA